MVIIYISGNSYIVDSYSNYAASAISAKNMTVSIPLFVSLNINWLNSKRSLIGASVPLWITQLLVSVWTL